MSHVLRLADEIGTIGPESERRGEVVLQVTPAEARLVAAALRVVCYEELEHAASEDVHLYVTGQRFHEAAARRVQRDVLRDSLRTSRIAFRAARDLLGREDGAGGDRG